MMILAILVPLLFAQQPDQLPVARVAENASERSVEAKEQADSAQGNSQIAVVVAGISIFGTAILAPILAYFKGRDERNAQVRIAILENKVEVCEKDHTKSQEDLVETKSSLVECKQDHEANDRRISKLEEALAKLPRRRDEQASGSGSNSELGDR